MEKISVHVTKRVCSQRVHQGNNAITECIDTKYSIEECGFKNDTCYANIIVRETKPNTEFQRPFESAQEKKKEK